MRTSIKPALYVLFSVIIACGGGASSDSGNAAGLNITVGPEGGTYAVDDTMTITFPEGALPAETDLTVYRLSAHDWQGAFSNYSEDSITGLAAFRITPDTVEFDEPVTAEFIETGSGSGTVPLLHRVDMSTGVHFIAANTTTEFDNENDILTNGIISGGCYVTEAGMAWSDTSGKLRGDACRDGLIIVKTGDSDVQCTEQNCQIIETSVEVQFMSCPGEPVESAILRESSGSCEAKMYLSSSSTMGTESTLPVNAKVKIACKNIGDQTVKFSATGPGSIAPAEDITDPEGLAEATVSSNEYEGIIEVTSKANVRYPVREIIVNDSVEEAFYRTDPLEEKTEIRVKELPVWHVTLDVTLADAQGFWGTFNDFVNYTACVEADIALDTDAERDQGHYNLNATQSLGSITFLNLFPEIQTSVTLVGTDAPSPFPCRMGAWQDIDFDDNIHFSVYTRDGYDDFASWEVEITYIYNLEPPYISEPFISGFFAHDGSGPEFLFPIQDAPYSTTGYMTTVTYDGTYSLEVTKVTE